MKPVIALLCFFSLCGFTDVYEHVTVTCMTNKGVFAEVTGKVTVETTSSEKIYTIHPNATNGGFITNHKCIITEAIKNASDL